MGWVREESNPNVGRNDLKRGEEKEKRKNKQEAKGGIVGSVKGIMIHGRRSVDICNKGGWR